MTVKVAIFCYSSTGTVHASAEAIDQNPRGHRHRDATRSVPVAQLDDLAWADAYPFGTPTRKQ
ncbi:hypothetical protein [Rhodococcus sp. NPDC058639]|uniref:hypothetical protein n=1 Tax=Rhodococcus sp. NPDC058639 TaxID=3346570 RepID=UPI00365BF564